jgi:hypothetical protein
MPPGKARKRVLASLVAAAAAISVCLAPAAEAATVTVGSPMNGVNDGGFLGNNGSDTTVANLSLFDPAAHVTSPVNGTIVQWRVNTLGTGVYALRVLRPAGTGVYSGAGSAPQNITTAGFYTFAASLPIQAGDLIGIDLPNNQGINASNFPGSHWFAWVPTIPEGSPGGASAFDFTNSELAFNADVQSTDAPPTPTPPAKKCKKKKHKRSASAAKKKCKKKKKK